jgi:hypothetical protein
MPTKGHTLFIIDKTKIAIKTKYIKNVPDIIIHFGKREVKNIKKIVRIIDAPIIPIIIATT